MKVEQLMTREVRICTESDTLNRAAQLMWECDCGLIPVTSTNGDGKVIGVVTDRDIAMAAYTQGKQLWAIPVTEAMAQKVFACHANDGISQAEASNARKSGKAPARARSKRPVGRDPVAQRRGAGGSA